VAVRAISGTLVKSSPDRCGYGFAFSQHFPLQDLEPSIHFNFAFRVKPGHAERKGRSPEELRLM
jgi:hypothetical protein